MSAYVFILCPPFSGSTVLWKLVSTSQAVSFLPNEGQFLPEVRDVMRRAPWNPDTKLPWLVIRNVWHGYWDQTKPLLVEKSPPNLIRTGEILEHFQPAYFLLMVRNPYAHCESLIRRLQWDPGRAARFAIRCLQQQADNAESLDNALAFTYEALTEGPEQISREIQDFIPGIGPLRHAEKFTVASIYGQNQRGLVNLNRAKIENLSPASLTKINHVLMPHADTMRYWKYDFMEPSLGHFFAYVRRKGRVSVFRGRRFARRSLSGTGK